MDDTEAGGGARSRRGRRGRQRPQRAGDEPVEASAAAKHVQVPIAEPAEVQVTFCGAAKVLAQNKFAALAEDGSEVDDGGIAAMAAAPDGLLSEKTLPGYAPRRPLS